MKITDANSFVQSIGIDPPFEEIYDFADRLGGLHLNLKGEYERHVYVRGPILYSLIAKFKPKTVLEFGTAGGYSALCMARAMSDYDIDGQIFTIDRFPMNFPHKRVMKDNSGNISTIFSSNRTHWPKIAPKEWIEKIIPITGHSGQVMSKTKLPKIEFSYIDAAHHYEGVKHDFYSLLNIASENFGVLLDDYIERPFYGITKLVDEEIKNNFDVTLIKTDEINISSTKTQRHGMIWFRGESAKIPMNEIFPTQKLDDFLTKYRRYEKYITANRHKLNTKIPSLAKIKFRFWKKNS